MELNDFFKKMNITPPTKGSGMVKEEPVIYRSESRLVEEPVCLHPGHAFPMHLHVPSGYRYEHVCPACGHVTIGRNSMRY